VRAPVGDANLADQEYCIGRGLASIEAGDLLDPKYLYFFILTRHEYLKSLGTGSTFQSINGNVVRELQIPLPPVDDQRHIAVTLSTIQQAKTAHRATLSALRTLKASLLESAFADELGPESSVPHSFGNAPRDWDIRPLRELGSVQTGLAKGRKVAGEVIALPYLRVANVQDGRLDLREIKTIEISPHEVDRFCLQPGDVLLTEGGDDDKLGRGFIWRGEIATCLHQNHIFAVRPRTEVLAPEYLAYYLQGTTAKRYFAHVAHRTTNLASINTVKLGALPVRVPGMEVQTRVVESLSAVDAAIEQANRTQTALDVTFRSALARLIRGPKG
jgi:type I restriction enzyme S subunit